MMGVDDAEETDKTDETSSPIIRAADNVGGLPNGTMPNLSSNSLMDNGSLATSRQPELLANYALKL